MADIPEYNSSMNGAPLYIDIETIPDQRPDAIERIAEDMTPPGNYKNPQAIEKWHKFEKPKKAEEQWKKTSLDGSRGQIVVIGYAIGDGPATTISRDIKGDEKRILKEFWEQLSKTMVNDWVGHNVVDFDMRFLYQRSVVHQVQPTAYFPYSQPQWGQGVFDTMYAWAGRNNRISLKHLCEAIGVPYNDEIDGSMVWDLMKEGQVSKVAAYCAQDVEAVREAYKILNFGIV